MQYRLLIQYVDKNPDDLLDKGITDLDNAINEFNIFNWKKQIKTIENRSDQNLTSVQPTIILKSLENDESLVIQYIEDGEFLITYQFESKIGTVYVSENINKNQSGNSVEDYIVALFQNDLEAQFKFEEIPTQEIILLGKYNPKKHLVHLWAFVIPFVFIILAPETDFEKFNIIKFIGVFSLIIAIFYLPFIAILIQYFSKPKLYSASIDPESGKLKLSYVDDVIEIDKSDIFQCIYTFSSTQKLPWSSLGNIVITTRNQSQYYLTTLTFSESELGNLIELLKVNYYYFDTAFQFLKTRIFSEKATINTNRENLQELYSTYSAENLKDIIENAEDYQPGAVEIAKTELKKRNK